MTVTFVRHSLAPCCTVLKTVLNVQYSKSFFGSCFMSVVRSKFRISVKIALLGMRLVVLLFLLVFCLAVFHRLSGRYKTFCRRSAIYKLIAANICYIRNRRLEFSAAQNWEINIHEQVQMQKTRLFLLFLLSSLFIVELSWTIAFCHNSVYILYISWW